MPRRPPQHPLLRGLVWRALATDEGAADDPIEDWAYVTPQEPDGLSTSALQRAAKSKQIEVARFWFLSNYEPFINDGRWFTLGVPGRGIGQAPLAPDYASASSLLREEFAGVIPDEVLGQLAGRLEAQSGLWTPIPDPPQIMLTVADGIAHNRLAAVEAALANVQSAVQALEASQVGIGHNQGPHIFDPRLREEIVQAVQLARSGTAAAEAGGPALKAGGSRLQSAMAVLGAAIVAGVGKQVGEDVYHAALPAALRLFHSLNEAVASIVHLLATYPPPLLT